MSAPIRTGGPWKVSEERLLRELYGSLPLQDIADRLGRTVMAVQQRVGRLKLTKHPTHRWTTGDMRLLESELVAMLDRTASAIGASRGAVLARINRDGRTIAGVKR